MLTDVALAKQATALGRRRRRRWVLDLRRRRGARLAHRISAMHFGRYSENDLMDDGVVELWSV